MICTLCGHTATRKVGHKGYCTFHAREAFVAQSRVLERFDAKWADMEAAKKRKDYHDLNALSRHGQPRLNG